jgi:hypothetical protein
MSTRSLEANFGLTGYLPDHCDQRIVSLCRLGMPKSPLARKAESELAPFSTGHLGLNQEA